MIAPDRGDSLRHRVRDRPASCSDTLRIAAAISVDDVAEQVYDCCDPSVEIVGLRRRATAEDECNE
jgi:hypothetical protein